MKRFHVLIPIFLSASLACGIFSTAVPEPTPIAVLATPLPTDESPTPQGLVDESATEPPAVTVPAPVASPQPAVAHHHPGDPISLDQIRMLDASHGWAISGGDVLFTADGAQTWREATPPEELRAGSKVQAYGAFLDINHAWIIFSVDQQIAPEAVVWHTSDSGHNWTASAPLLHEAFGEFMWAEFFALDEAHIWLIVRGVYVGAGTHHSGQLLRSIDSGLTWSPLAGDYNYDYTGLVFADADHGLVTWETVGAYAPSPPQYAVTSDGGDHWQVRELPAPPASPDLFNTFDYCEPFQPQMLSSRSIYVLMGCFDSYDPPHAFTSYLYSSEDGGSTWTSTPLPEKVLANQDTLFFFDKDHSLLLGRDIYHSANGGLSWEYAKSVTWDGQFTFVDPQMGWAIAHANDQLALVKTSNGGASWIEIKPVIAR